MGVIIAQNQSLFAPATVFALYIVKYKRKRIKLSPECNDNQFDHARVGEIDEIEDVEQDQDDLFIIDDDIRANVELHLMDLQGLILLNSKFESIWVVDGSNFWSIINFCV